MKNSRCLLLFCILAFAGCHAQTFTHEGSLPPVEKDGFYRIPITPALGSYLNIDYGNIRIIDQKNNKEVPFLTQEENSVYTKQEFREYAILEKKQVPNCCTSLIFKNGNKKPINNLSLIIKNAEVEKEATLLGSDDRRQWYALKQDFTFQSINSQTTTTEVRIVDFPLSNYLYYSLRLSDSTTAPLNILKAGFYDVQTETGKYTEVPGMKVHISDSAREKSTYIQLSFDREHFIDKLELSLTGTPYYLRTAYVYELRQITVTRGRKNRKENVRYMLQEIELSSTHASSISFSNTKFKDLWIVIRNEDNPALTVAGVKAYQLNRYLTAWLKKGETYTLKIGNGLQVPSYDLGFFRDSIPKNPATLEVKEIMGIQSTKANDGSKTYFSSRLFIWVAIAAVIGILGFMSFKMVKETKSEK